MGREPPEGCSESVRLDHHDVCVLLLYGSFLLGYITYITRYYTMDTCSSTTNTTVRIDKTEKHKQNKNPLGLMD